MLSFGGIDGIMHDMNHLATKVDMIGGGVGGGCFSKQGSLASLLL